MIKMMKNPQTKDWEEILKRNNIDFSELEATVNQILCDVKNHKDIAIQKLSLKFDGISFMNMKVSKQEFDEVDDKISYELKNAIILASKNIELFHQSQKEKTEIIETTSGVFCWREPRAIQKVGLYIPGGTAPLFSTVLMLAIPAKIAGCNEIYLCTPPSQDGTIHPAIIFAAKIAGVDQIYKVGGAQAIAALAYGTETIPRVNKIFGPGNQFVTLAKQLVAKEGVAIDMPAGPSEVAIIADQSCNPSFVAADMLSQAEHGNDSQAILFTNSENIAYLVNQEVEKQLAVLPRKEIALKALKNSKIILLDSISTCIDISNEYAPEHLILSCENAETLIQKVVNAGSVFIGNYTPESAGDYASGTNHTLPTNGYAKSFSGVSLDSFLKKISFQQITKEGLNNIGPIIETMATAEQLFAHKNAVTIRLSEINK